MSEIRTVCVYCGSASHVKDAYREAAHQLGTLLAEGGYGIVYGGGRVGLMGIVADAALGAGGEVVGVMPEIIKVREVEHQALTELVLVDSMHDRKRMMVDRSDAFVVLPGGLGTLDETIEVLTWRQLGLHDNPIIIVDVDDYWQPLKKLIKHVIGERFAGEGVKGLITFVDKPKHVLKVLKEAHVPSRPPDVEHL